MAPPDDKIEGFFGLVSFFSPIFSAARWIGLSLPASLREVIVNVRICDVVSGTMIVVGLLRIFRSASIEWIVRFEHSEGAVSYTLEGGHVKMVT